MRSKEFGMTAGLANKFTKQAALGVFKKMCLIREFEENVKIAYDKKLIRCPIYLSLGQEAIPAAISMQYMHPVIFAQHRAHGTYLAFGGNVEKLIDELLHKPTGCAKGMGGSASIHDPSINMVGHDGLMGSQIPIAVGYAIGSGKNTLAIMGDASAEEDYVIAALGYASKKKAPVLFVCEDNNLSILTKVSVRRNWSIVDVAKAYKMPAAEITDDPWLIMHHVNELIKELPAFLNIHTTRNVWHAGIGSDGPPEWDRYALVKEELNKLGLTSEYQEIEQKTKDEISTLWKTKIGELQNANVR